MRLAWLLVLAACEKAGETQHASYLVTHSCKLGDGERAETFYSVPAERTSKHDQRVGALVDKVLRGGPYTPEPGPADCTLRIKKDGIEVFSIAKSTTNIDDDVSAVLAAMPAPPGYALSRTCGDSTVSSGSIVVAPAEVVMSLRAPAATVDKVLRGGPYPSEHEGQVCTFKILKDGESVLTVDRAVPSLIHDALADLIATTWP